MSPKAQRRTERTRQLTEKLKESEELFSTAFRNNPAALIITRIADNHFVDVNETFLRLFEYGRDDVIGHTSKELKLFPTYHVREEAVERALKNGSVRDIETDVRTKTGRLLIGLFSMEIVNIRGQKHMLTTVTDITERKRLEEALKEEEQRLLLAQQVARIGTFDWNIQTGEDVWTPELEAMYGLPPGNFPGREEAWEAMVHPDDRGEVFRRIEDAIERGSFEAEWRVIWPDGSIHWQYGRARVFKDTTGKPLKMLGVNIDITEIKRRRKH